MAPAFILKEFETPRLRLRKLAIYDAAQLVLLRSDKRVNCYLNRPASTSPEEAVQFVNKILMSNAYYWAINLKNETKLIGTVCLWNLDRENSVVEIGYELLPQFQGEGLMMEVLRAIIAYNSTVLQFATIIGTTHIENISSLKLLEKNNFKRDRTRENQFHKEGGSLDEIIYSLQNT
jgi:ribosomal-protein-alanine N-acetyltransferase